MATSTDESDDDGKMCLYPSVDRCSKRVAREGSRLHSHSRTHHPRTRPWKDRTLSSNSDTSVHSWHMQPSLPHDVGRGNRKKMGTHMLPPQRSEDGRYSSRPISRPAVGSEYSDRDSPLSSSDRDGMPVVTAVGPSSRSRGIYCKGQARKLPNALDMLTKAKCVEVFKSEHGQVRKSLIEALGLNRRLQDTPALLAEMLSVTDLVTKAGSEPQIGDVVDLWIGKILKDSSLFGLAMGLARVQGLGRYITCIVQSTGSLTQDELVRFTKALDHSWTIFAQKIGFEEEELKVVDSKQLSKKGFFAEIWLVPKFDNGQVEHLLCELLTTVQQDDVLHKYQSRLPRALDSSDGSKSESDVPSNDTDTDTDTPTDTDTSAESEAEGPRKDDSATVIGRNEDTLGTKVASQSSSGLLSSPGSGSGGSNGIHHTGQSKQQPTALTAQEKKCVEIFKSEHGQVRKSLIEALQLNRRLQDTPALLAEMLSVTDSATIAGSEPQIGDVVDLWIGKILKDSSLFGLAMGLAHVQGLGRYITCIAQSMGCLTAAELVHFSKALGHSWMIFAQKIGYEAEELKVDGSSKLSKKTFFAKIWLVPKFDDDQVKNLLCELLTAIQLDISTLVTSASTFKMSLLDASEGSRSDLDMVSTETETETETPSESEEERAKNEVSFVGQNCNSLGAKVASQSDSGLVSAPSSGSAAWSMETSLSASSVPPTCEVYSDSDSPFSSRNRDEVPAATAVGPSSGSRGIHCKGQSKKLEANFGEVLDFRKLLKKALTKGYVEVEIVKCVTFGPPEAGKTQLKSGLMGRFDDSKESTNVSTAADIVMQRCVCGKTSWELLTQEQLLKSLHKTVATEDFNAKAASATSSAAAKMNAVTSSVKVEEPGHQRTVNSTIHDEVNRNDALLRQFSTLIRRYVERELMDCDSTEVRCLQKLRMIHFIDSGGQPAFLDVHPVITSSRAYYLLVYNMEEGLEAKPKFTYRKSSFSTNEVPNKKKSNMDMISESLLVLHHCQQKFAKMDKKLHQWFGKSIVQGENLPVLVVGTRRDDQKMVSESEKLSAGCGHLPTWSEVLDCTDSGTKLFAVESKNQRCKGLQSVRDVINEMECSYRLPLPISWVLCQLIFWSTDQEEFHVLNYADLQDICLKEDIVATNEEFLAMIRVFHYLGIFCFPYFDQEQTLGDGWKPDTHPVFTNPDMLYRHVTKILEVGFINLVKTKMILETKKRLRKLQNDGRLCIGTLCHLNIPDQLGSFSGFQSYLLELLVQWGLAAKLDSMDSAGNAVTDTDFEYFIPSVLAASGHEYGLNATDISIDLAFTFVMSQQNMPFYDIPQGIFPHVVVNILTAHKHYNLNPGNRCLFRDMAIFVIRPSPCNTMNYSYNVLLTENMDHISIRIQPSHAAMNWTAPDCHQIMSDFQIAIEDVHRQMYLTDHSVTLACQCPCRRFHKDHLAAILSRTDQCYLQCLSIGGLYHEEYCPEQIATIVNQGSGRVPAPANVGGAKKQDKAAATAKQVLNQFRSQFLECLDANTIVYELHYRDIIAEGDLTDIRRTLAARQQNAILHACLLRTCDEEALMKVCEIIEQGYPTMKALGRKMKSMLDESVQHVEQLIGSSKREEEMRLLGLSKMNSEEMLAYVSRQVGQKWSMLARYAGLEEDEIQEIKRSAQDRPCTTMKKIQERLTWNELLVIVQKHMLMLNTAAKMEHFMGHQVVALPDLVQNELDPQQYSKTLLLASHYVSGHWKELAQYLGVDPCHHWDVLEESSDADEKCHGLLLLWLSGRRATLQELLEAVESTSAAAGSLQRLIEMARLDGQL